ncbi:hypothetical protein P7K49_022709 [Saguinus oedipus]|uniref:Uncharacterized protein n=1 Tax=Saguinus oedipus TaxID=9490 RepID=A0ABQ9UJP2_SAGOE|nr:hypothetical protein P7K49_022709 [Saguinus oedipus]
MAEEPEGPSRGWDSELSGEVDAEDGECTDGARGREPGMATGAEPASNLGPGGGGPVSEGSGGGGDTGAGPGQQPPSMGVEPQSSR